MLPALSAKDLARFRSRVSVTDDCHIWTGSINKYGYGHFGYVTDQGTKIFRAHRVSHELFNGEIPEGMQVDHTCYNKACVNPKHLRLTTHKQNQENRPRARQGSSSGVRGVYWDKRRGKWGTCITHNNRRISAGRYDLLEDAAAAVAARRNELFTHNDMDRSAA